ncbi:hypothetical protein BDV33DRAFT_229564 [Aspergillus novoparasiticus]|uniref:Aminoglycoside phosphotransferase domain-containing protein n=1 Tax=Aspergillus novoparasiticus TaxID=986946 RepID=A0A5N6EZ11_9EURO|nr:hypothetical protein BDV33DRAFT_229564 [Aspergillus novoparasiticus]
MGHEDKASICRELRTIDQRQRQVEQDPENPFIGSIRKGPLYDRAFHVNYMYEAGPFRYIPVEPFRHVLPDDCAIKFTHGDLHRSNIIVTPTTPYCILALVDWEQSGWLPEYWETQKARCTADRGESWSTTYLPEILGQFASTWNPWDYYTSAMGC